MSGLRQKSVLARDPSREPGLPSQWRPRKFRCTPEVPRYRLSGSPRMTASLAIRGGPKTWFWSLSQQSASLGTASGRDSASAAVRAIAEPKASPWEQWPPLDQKVPTAGSRNGRVDHRTSRPRPLRADGGSAGAMDGPGTAWRSPDDVDGPRGRALMASVILGPALSPPAVIDETSSASGRGLGFG